MPRNVLHLMLAHVLLVSACGRPQSAPALHIQGDSALVSAFAAAAQHTHVPADFLVAWAFLETRMQPVVPDPMEGMQEHDGHPPPAFGVMGLTEAQMARAAELTGLDVDMIRRDDAANIAAGAAIIRAGADATAHLEGRLDLGSSPAAWTLAMADARGLGEHTLRSVYLGMVQQHIAHGLEATDAQGGTIQVDGRGAYTLPARQVLVSALNPQDPFAARFIASPHHSGRSGAAIDRVVIHTTQGSYAGAVSWFQNSSSQVSSHYVIRSSDGEITQMVLLENRAWHAGNSNYNARSVGIEHEGYVSDPGRWYTEAMYSQSAQLVAWLTDRYGIPRDRAHIIGHYQIPSSGSGAACSPNATTCGGAGHHTDPGNGGTAWNWDHFMDLMNGGSSGGSSSGGTGAVQVVGVTYNAELGSQARIAGATVAIGQNGTTLATTTANATGYWEFNVPAAGVYQLEASAQGYQSATWDVDAAAGSPNWASMGLSPAVAVQNGTYRGVVYQGPGVGENPISGALVTLSTGLTYTTGDNGAFVFDLPAGDVSATATRDGFTPATVTRTVVAGATTWGSIQLSPAVAVQTGTLRGVIYQGPGLGENPVTGAQVRLDTGASTTTGADGAYVFTVAAGDVTATASKAGYTTATVTRTVAPDATTWGSVLLGPLGTGETGNAPDLPVPGIIAPTQDQVLAGGQVTLVFSRVAAADGYLVEVYAGNGATGTPVASLAVPQTGTSPVSTVLEPGLAEGAYVWRVRSTRSGGEHSAFTDPSRFVVQAESTSSSAASSSSSSAGASPESGPGASSSSSSGGFSADSQAAGSASAAGNDPGNESAVVGCTQARNSGTAGLGLLLLGTCLLQPRRQKTAQQHSDS